MTKQHGCDGIQTGSKTPDTASSFDHSDSGCSLVLLKCLQIYGKIPDYSHTVDNTVHPLALIYFQTMTMTYLVIMMWCDVTYEPESHGNVEGNLFLTLEVIVDECVYMHPAEPACAHNWDVMFTWNVYKPGCTFCCTVTLSKVPEVQSLLLLCSSCLSTHPNVKIMQPYSLLLLMACPAP